MPYLRYMYLCLIAYSGVQHILCCVFVFLSSSCVPYVPSFAGMSIFIAPSVFSKVYSLTASMNYLVSNTNLKFEVAHFIRNAFHEKSTNVYLYSRTNTQSKN
jgi:hypothetical protein